jgi:hypothetical protein
VKTFYNVHNNFESIMSLKIDMNVFENKNDSNITMCGEELFLIGMR